MPRRPSRPSQVRRAARLAPHTFPSSNEAPTHAISFAAVLMMCLASDWEGAKDLGASAKEGAGTTVIVPRDACFLKKRPKARSLCAALLVICLLREPSERGSSWTGAHEEGAPMSKTNGEGAVGERFGRTRRRLGSLSCHAPAGKQKGGKGERLHPKVVLEMKVTGKGNVKITSTVGPRPNFEIPPAA